MGTLPLQMKWSRLGGQLEEVTQMPGIPSIVEWAPSLNLITEAFFIWPEQDRLSAFWYHPDSNQGFFQPGGKSS